MRAFNILGPNKQYKPYLIWTFQHNAHAFSEKEEGEGGGLKILIDRADIGCMSTKSI